MRKKRFHSIWTAAFALSALFLLGGTVKPAMAYLTDIAEDMDNKFTIALDSTSKVVEKFPDPNPDLSEDSIASYEKAVQVILSLIHI